VPIRTNLSATNTGLNPDPARNWRAQKSRRHLQNGRPSGTHPERTLGTHLAVKRGLRINPREAIDALHAFVTIKLGVVSTI